MKISLKFFVVTLLLVGACQSHRWALVTTYPHPHAPAFVSIVFVNSRSGWGLTTSQLLKTDDGGKTWNEELSDETKSFYALQFVNASTAFIAGTQRLSFGHVPAVVRTKDGGKSWQESSVPVSTKKHKQPIGFQSIDFIDDRVGWIAGNGLIARTGNGGDSWEIQRDNGSEVIFGVDALTPQVVLAVGTNGHILRTIDGGQNWIQGPPVTSEHLTRIRTFAEVTWVLGRNGTVLRSVDRGETWQRIHVNTTEDLMDIYVTDRHAWIVGTRGVILGRDRTGMWLRENAPIDKDLVTLFFLNSEGWIGGAQQTLLHLQE